MAEYPSYSMKKDESGYWYWIYYAGNREEIARSSESYHNYDDCLHAIRLVQKSAKDPVYHPPGTR